MKPPDKAIISTIRRPYHRSGGSSFSILIVCMMLLASLIPVAACLAQPASASLSDDGGELDGLLDSLEGLGLGAQEEALLDYLERYPDSPKRLEIEALLSKLHAPSRAGESLSQVDYPSALLMPEAFPSQRVRADLAFGAPDWARALLHYAQPIKEELLLEGTVGRQEGDAMVEVGGRYRLFKTPRAQQLISLGGMLRAKLGDDSQFFLEPNLSYLSRRHGLDLQVRYSPELRLTNGVQLRHQIGIFTGKAWGRWWSAIELDGTIHRVLSERPEFPDPIPVLVGFMSANIGTQYRPSSSLAFGVNLSLPIWSRYQRDYTAALGLLAEYHFGVMDPS